MALRAGTQATQTGDTALLVHVRVHASRCGCRLHSGMVNRQGVATVSGIMAVPAAQLDLGRPFQEKLSCSFDERRQIFVCEDGALVPEQISFYFHFRELVVGVNGVAESLIAIQSGLKFDCRHPAKVVML